MNHHVLFPIIERLEANNISYSLGGSGLLFRLGLVESVNDWDITVECPKESLVKAIDGYDWIEQQSGDYPFASQYRISIVSLNIDIIGHFALFSGDEVINLPIASIGQWDGIQLSSPEVWFVAYRLMNRHAKANTILKYLKTNIEKANVNIVYDLLRSNGLKPVIQDELRSLLECEVE